MARSTKTSKAAEPVADKPARKTNKGKRRHVIDGKIRYVDADLHGPALAAAVDEMRASVAAEIEADASRVEQAAREETLLAQGVDPGQVGRIAELQAAVAEQFAEREAAREAGELTDLPPASTELPATSIESDAHAEMLDALAAETATRELEAQVVAAEQALARTSFELTMSVRDLGLASTALGRFAYRDFDRWGEKLSPVRADATPMIVLSVKERDALVAALAAYRDKISGKAADADLPVVVDELRARVNTARALEAA